MSGICSEHRGHEPSCPRCMALPLDTRTDGREDTPGNEPLPSENLPVPQERKEHFHPINRAARRAAAKQSRRAR